MKRKVSDYPGLNTLNRFTHRSNILPNWKWSSTKSSKQHPPSAINQQSIICYSLWSWVSKNKTTFFLHAHTTKFKNGFSVL